jgi:hypothetical protein
MRHRSPLISLLSEWEPHVSPRKENDHHASSSANASARNRFVAPIPPLNIEGLYSTVGRADERGLMTVSLFERFTEYATPHLTADFTTDTRSSYKSQFSQISQTMGNFRHHSSRLDERAERDSHERLRNVRRPTFFECSRCLILPRIQLSESYDRNKLLASSASPRRDPLPKNGASFVSRRGDDRDKDARDKDMKDRSDLSPWDRRDNGRSERSSDWRRCENFPKDGFRNV